MTGTSAATPHDQFFKALMERPGAAGALLRERLPPAVTAILAADVEPELIPGSFIDPELAEHRTDRLYRCRTTEGAAVFVYVLVEHKSEPDSRVGLQLLRYLSRAWESIDRDAGRAGKLPVIVPMVVYHGAAPWPGLGRFAEMLDGPAAALEHSVDFAYRIVDLGRIEDRRLSALAALRFGLALLKHAMLGTDPRHLLDEEGVAILRADPEFLWAALHYMLRMMGTPDRAAARDLAAKVRRGEEEAVVSKFAEDLLKEGERRGWVQGLAAGKKEGLSQGLSQGLTHGKAESLVRLLERRFRVPVPDDKRALIDAAPASLLNVWLDAVLEAETMDAVFQRTAH